MNNRKDIADEFIEGVPTSKLINLARLGMIALVDEATGYEKVRPKDALRKKMKELEDNVET